jgi:Short C-terminal domain
MAQVAAAQAAQTQGGTRAPSGAKSPADSVSDVVETLEKLADLHDRGVLSDAEFQAQKARLLAD